MAGQDGDYGGIFFFQSGCCRQPRAIPERKNGEQPGTMEMMYSRAAAFLDHYYPQHAYVNIHNRLSLFLLDDNGLSIGKITEVQQIKDGDTVLIAVTGPPESHPSLLVPHNVAVHSYMSPTFCDFCGEMLYGLIRQGLKCQGCGHNFHRRCADKVPNSCPMSKQGSVYQIKPNSSPSMESANVPVVRELESIDSASSQSLRSPRASITFGRPQWIDRAVMEAEFEGKVREHQFAIHNYLQPTVCTHCRKLLLGVFRQGFRCKTCRLNAHKGCLKSMQHIPCVPHGSAPSASSSVTDAGGPALVLNDGGGHMERQLSDESYEGDQTNIPLQRICMSVRRSARSPLPEVVFAGWMVFHKKGSGDYRLRYWVLDSHGVKIVASDTPADRASDSHCHSIPLAAILEIIFTANERHMFEMVVNAEGVYCVGENIVNFTKSALAPYCRLPPPEEVVAASALQKGTTFKELLQQAQDEKRVHSLYNFLISAHKPVEGAMIMRAGPAKAPVATRGAAMAPTATKSAAATTTSSPPSTESQTDDGEEEESTYAALPPTLLAEMQRVREGGNSHASPINSSSEASPLLNASLATSPSQQTLSVNFAENTFKPAEAGDPDCCRGHKPVTEKPSTEMSTIYQVFPDEILGSGQFGIVLAGEHRVDRTRVAIKVVEKGPGHSDTHNSQMKNEAKILESMGYPGIISVFNMFESEKRILIVMERMDTDMLDMILSSPKGRLDERVGRFLMYQIFSALRHLHLKSIAHCDLKPENCLLTGDPDFPQVKLCDFGFARVIGEHKFRKTVVGTPAYLAPEVLNNKGYNLSLDCWSAGVVVYVTLSGTFPFNDGDEITDQINSAEFLFPSNPWRHISAAAQHLIINLLTLQPRKRLTTHKSMNHKWFASKELWDDLRVLEKKVGERYITHEAEDEFWLNGGAMRLSRVDDGDTSDNSSANE